MIYLGNKPVGPAVKTFNPLKYAAYCYQLFRYAQNLPETMILDFEGQTNIRSDTNTFFYMFESSAGMKHLIIRNLISPDGGIGVNHTFNVSGLEDITFENCTPFKIRSASRTFSNGDLLRVVGAIDCSPMTSGNNDAFYYCTHLVDAEFVPNTINTTISFSGDVALSDNTLVSIANGLNPDYASSVSFATTPKARLNTLMGNNDNGTFVADENGLMTLGSFITTIKGWTY